MKAVILAAGYGTRLQRDVLADTTGRFAHLAHVAKPLLPVGRCPLSSRWIHALTVSGSVDTIYVVTNTLYLRAFEEWATNFTNVQILSDQTTSNDERLGAVACLQLAVKHFNIEDHVIVIGGDTLFKEDFSLRKVKERFSDVQSKCEDSCLVLSYQCRDEGEVNKAVHVSNISRGFASSSQLVLYFMFVCSETQKYGILEADTDLRVLCMKEKPLPSETKSRRACPCFYMFSKRSLRLLDTFLEEKKDAPITEKDAPGNFVSWLIPRKPVYIQEISGRFDVGNLPSYVECDLYFKEKLQDVESYMV
uniref:Nucleotidyl transferase domain-containing protein n=1 Tax=Astatotilapia calliptera TaxID=8154 RepID=A0A3P8NE98_ASTCA